MKERSIFWPLVLIATGVLWLMVGMGIIPRANLWALTHTFPIILIALGLGLILRAYWRFAGMLVSLLVVGGAVMAVIYAPQLGWDKAPDWGWGVLDFDPEIGGGVSGSGVIRTEERRVSEFDKIAIDFPADIIVRQGKSESLTIEADDNLLPQLTTEVRNGTLEFKNSERRWSERVNPSEPVFLTITVVDLDRVSFPSAGQMLISNLETDSLAISVSGAGDIELIDLDVGNLEFSLSGAGNVYADGAAEELHLRISGLGSFSGDDLETQYANVSISGAGSANVWVGDELDARISGAGSVVYYGNPDVSKSISGVGSVSSAGEK
jgi:hypothetical protein